MNGQVESLGGELDSWLCLYCSTLLIGDERKHLSSGKLGSPKLTRILKSLPALGEDYAPVNLLVAKHTFQQILRAIQEVKEAAEALAAQRELVQEPQDQGGLSLIRKEMLSMLEPTASDEKEAPHKVTCTRGGSADLSENQP
ncbi:hypothetical protein QOT17_000447 [Balamuthia mandrillaris]